MSFFDDLLEGSIQYGLPTALGGLTGFIASGGNPAGALVGAGLGLSSAIAGPKAAKALPKGTPEWARVAMEYGIYGLGSGVGIGAGLRLPAQAGARGLARLIGAHAAGTGVRQLANARLARASLEFGAATAAGAVSGRAISHVAGIPEGIGQFLGSVAMPVGGPHAAASLRSAAYRRGGGVRSLAEAVGATEANAVRARRTVDPTKITINSLEDDINGALAQAQYARETMLKLHPEMTEDFILGITGGVSEATLNARRMGRVPPDLQEVITPEYLKAKKNLTPKATRVANAIVREAEARTVVEGMTMPTSNGELVTIEGKYFWRTPPSEAAPAGATKMYHGTAGEIRGGQLEAGTFLTPRRADATSFSRSQAKLTGEPARVIEVDVMPGSIEPVTDDSLVAARGGVRVVDPAGVSIRHPGGDIELDAAQGAAYSQARNALESAKLRKATAEESLRTHLGTPDIPETYDDQLAALKDKYVPNWREIADQGELLSRADARRLWPELQSAKADHRVAYGNRMAALEGRAANLEALAAFRRANPVMGASAPGKQSLAARSLAVLRDMEARIAKYPRGYLAPRESAHTFGDYLEYANFIAKGESPNRRTAKLLEVLQNPRGSVWVASADGIGVEARTLVAIDPAKGTATVRSQFQPELAADVVPLESLRIRYSQEQIMGLAGEISAAAKNQLGSRTRVAVRAEIDRLPQPQVLQQERFFATRDQLDKEIAAYNHKIGQAVAVGLFPKATPAQKAAAVKRVAQLRAQGPPDGSILEELRQQAFNDFASTSAPAESTFEFRFQTPEHQESIAAGLRNLMGRPPRKGASPEELAVWLESKTYITTPLAERGVFTADDPELLERLGAVFTREGGALRQSDPLTPILMLAARDDQGYARLTDNDITQATGGLRHFLKRWGIGESVQHPALKAILYDHFGDLEATANFTGGTYGPVIVSAQRLASRLLDEPQGIIPSVRAGTAALVESVRKLSKPGEVVAAFTDQLHPLSRQNSLPRYLTQHFNVERLPAPLRQQLADLYRDYPQYEGQVENWLMSQWRTYVDFPEAFVNIDPQMEALRRATINYDIALEHEITLLGATPQTMARRFSMLVNPKYRSNPRLDTLQGGNATLITLAREAIEAASGGTSTVPLSELLVYGADADMAVPVAAYQSMAVGELFSKIKKLAKPGETITMDDLIFKGGNWSIRSLNKWPKEVQESLTGLNDIIGGQHKWEGLQKWSQQIAFGNLAADLSLYGIQGFKFAAHSLLAGRPLRAMEMLARGTTHIMSDYGFYSWMRQNLDEITYLSSLGMTGGVKGYIAGPEIRRLPLEAVPVLGKIFGGIREGTDLQFNRALFYWKVQGIRENLEFAKTMRAIPQEIAARFVDSSPTAQTTAADMGGLDNYLLADHEDVVRAVVRQVNRSYGGVHMAAEGIGIQRQALEQIMLIVPGFFRAQAGQWAAVITKPHTLEGQLAISMLAREYMFAGMIATGMARMLGTSERLNFDDMTKPTWLGVPLPEYMGGGTMSLLPTMAIPRLASRVLRETVESAAAGDLPNYDRYLESFGRGRLSPLASPVVDLISGKDFYGRRYTDATDKWLSTATNVVLPIVGSTLIEDLKEAQRMHAATGDYGWTDVMANTGAQLLGKSVVPMQPRERLNNLAKAAYGNDWNLLTDAEKVELRRNPAVTAAEGEYNFQSSRRASSAESHVDQAYKRYAAQVERVWQEPTTIGNITSSQPEDDVHLARGEMTGDMWRERYHVRQQAVSQWYETLQQDIRQEGVDPDAIRQRKMDRLATAREPGDFAWLVQQARTDYAGVRPRSEKQTVVTPSGEAAFDVVDWDQFAVDREGVLARYPAAVRDAVRREVNKAEEGTGLAAYKKAQAAQQAIESLPRYRGLTVAQGEQVDAMRAAIARVGDSIRSQVALPSGASLPAGMVEQAALKQMVATGLLQSNADLTLVMLAVQMTRDTKLAEAMRNPAMIQAVLENPIAVLYYPYLRFRVPRVLYPRLPQQIFQAPAVAASLNVQTL